MTHGANQDVHGDTQEAESKMESHPHLSSREVIYSPRSCMRLYSISSSIVVHSFLGCLRCLRAEPGIQLLVPMREKLDSGFHHR